MRSRAAIDRDRCATNQSNQDGREGLHEIGEIALQKLVLRRLQDSQYRRFRDECGCFDSRRSSGLSSATLFPRLQSSPENGDAPHRRTKIRGIHESPQQVLLVRTVHSQRVARRVLQALGIDVALAREIGGTTSRRVDAHSRDGELSKLKQ